MAGADYDYFIFRNGVHMPTTSEMGTGRLRAKFHKAYPVLSWDGIDLDPELQGFEDEYFFSRDGYHFQCRRPDQLLDMELIEPDGTIWQGRGGYGFGDGFEDDSGTAEEFYREVSMPHFRWTPVDR